MGYLAGFIAGALCLGLAIPLGFVRDRSFYATVMIVVATYYLLFAAMAGSVQAFVAESLFATAFVVAAIVGFRTRLWIAVAALAMHGVFDAMHGHLVVNPGVPEWWPAFCGTIDVVLAAGLGIYLRQQAMRSRPQVTRGDREH